MLISEVEGGSSLQLQPLRHHQLQDTRGLQLFSFALPEREKDQASLQPGGACEGMIA